MHSKAISRIVHLKCVHWTKGNDHLSVTLARFSIISFTIFESFSHLSLQWKVIKKKYQFVTKCIFVFIRVTSSTPMQQLQHLFYVVSPYVDNKVYLRMIVLQIEILGNVILLSRQPVYSNLI